MFPSNNAKNEYVIVNLGILHFFILKSYSWSLFITMLNNLLKSLHLFWVKLIYKLLIGTEKELYHIRDNTTVTSHKWTMT